MTRSVTARLIPEYSYRSGQQYLGLRLTILHANLLDLPTASAAYVVPDQRYFVWTGQAHHLLEWPRAHLELETRIAVQRTGAHISDLHAVEIGGIASVRGFRENELLVGNAQNFNLDLHWLAIPYSGGARPGFTFGPFFDWASGRDVGEPTTTFSSIGATFRLKWARVQADLAIGKRLVEPGFVQQQHGSWQDHGIEAQVAASL